MEPIRAPVVASTPTPPPPLAPRATGSPPLARRLAFGRTSANEPPKWETRLNKTLDADQVIMFVDAMLKMPGNRMVQRQGCYALWKISLDGTVGRRAALGCSGPVAVVTAMRTYSDDAEIGRHGCAALENMTLDEQASKASIEAGAPAAVLAMLRSHENDIELQRLGLGALQNMAYGDESVKQALVRIHVVQVAVDLMKAYLPTAIDAAAPKPTPIPASITALEADEGDGAGGEPEHKFVAQQPLGQPTSKLAEDAAAAGPGDNEDEQPMLAWSQKEIQRNGCGVLRNIALGSEKLKHHVFAHNGIEAIVDAMRAYPTSAEIQATACAALHHIVAGDVKRPKEISAEATARRKELIQSGGLINLIEAMEQHEHNVDVQRNGCATLCSMALGDKACKKQLVRTGAQVSIATAMAAHDSDKELLHSGVWVIQLLATAAGMNECLAIARAGGVASVAGAMMGFVEDLTMCSRGCAALSSLASGGETEDDRKEICQLIVTAGGPSAIALALTEHQEDSGLQASGLAALTSLANVDAKSRSILVQLGACQSIVTSMRAHKMDVQVQRDGCRALESISMGDSMYSHTPTPSKQAVVEAGGSSVLLAALKNHNDDVEVRIHANGALKNIAASMRQLHLSSRRPDGQGGGDSRELPQIDERKVYRAPPGYLAATASATGRKAAHQ